ncbi:Transcriptional regulator, LuxR family [Candidatus Burkholderia verschuerenii]|uniref:Transcriptional regulator, LuxR family n=1 Tax=Candidatus Burkholderia verschuerenii TaxID=242163 RepID=A0A0L0MFW7_9BURK|nr:cyclic nucleotide-binding domain-containing protein [Candidatus Burkholderia verschuerenii]KND61201.1 Transcriptional regulator, LuxR family [Candidatus Burkholderia verschuerenii]
MNLLLTMPEGLCREGIVRLLREFAADIEVRASSDVTVIWHGERAADCVVIDGVLLNHARGELDALRACTRVAPVVVLLGQAMPTVVEQLMAAGVAGCIEMSASVELFFSALRLALAGGVYVPRSLLSVGLQEPPIALDALPAHDASLRLTPRQIEVLALVTRGRSNKMIARQLDMAEATAKTHLTTIYKALKVSSRGEASALAARFASVREAQANRSANGAIPVGRFLVNIDSTHYRAGEVLFREGDPGGELFYVERGIVRLAELGIELGAGSVFGEIGLFSPKHRRTSTAVCKTVCEMRAVSADDAIRLYYQEPEFAMYLINCWQAACRQTRCDAMRCA